MRRIIYLSAANNRYARDECEAIIAHAQKANARIGVTGMLIFIDGSFFQVLEGETTTVLALFEKIARDNRHKQLIKLIEEDITERAFPDWAMAWLEIDQGDPLSGRIIDLAAASRRGKAAQDIAPHVTSLIRSFVERAR